MHWSTSFLAQLGYSFSFSVSSALPNISGPHDTPQLKSGNLEPSLVAVPSWLQGTQGRLLAWLRHLPWKNFRE